MKAALYYRGEKQFRIEKVKIPEYKEKEVLVKVVACGLCGSDLHLLHGNLKPIKNPIIPGHEASGIIEDAGEQVQNFKKGDRVLISAGISCHQCEFCLSGEENLCEKVGVRGFQTDGAFAQYIAVSENHIIRLPDDVSLEEVSILADAVSTPYHAIRYVGNFREGQNIFIIGCGGLGIHAIKIAKVLKANEIIAFDIREEVVENVKRAGANRVFISNHIKEVIRKLQKTVRFSLILDFTGSVSMVEPSLRLLHPGGKYIMIGLGHEKLVLKIPSFLVFRSLSLCGSYGSNRRSLEELVSLYLKGELDLQSSISGIFPLEEINQAVKKLETREGNPIRLIIKPDLD